MNLKEKLARLDKGSSRQELPQLNSDQTTDVWIEDFQREFGAKIIRENSSLVIIKEAFSSLENYPFHQGCHDVNYVIPNFHHIFRDEWTRDFNLRDTLFIDLETTGLSGGTGTYAFLVGIGYLELDQIRVKQYVLPDFQYEWLLLKHVEGTLSGFNNIASFNGKSFDIPLLKNRFVLNRMDSVVDDLNHLDILHAARRLWKRRLASCDLGNLEYAILGQERIADIPGELIPQAYFEYIRKRKALILRDVLEHNFHDIVNMILLTMYLGAVVMEPLKYLDDDEDLYSLARFMYQNNHLKETKLLLSAVLNRSKNKLIQKEALFLLSMTHKKEGDFTTSRAFFEKLLLTQKDHPEALEELAKYYEHHEKNFPAALELIKEGLEYNDMMKQLGKPSLLDPFRDDLHYRRMRLERKLERLNQSK